MGSAARTAKLVAVTLFLFSAINCGALFLILARAFLFWNVPLRLKVDVQIQHLFLSLFTYMIERNANIRVVTTGDAIPERESAMIISNHLNQDWVRGCCVSLGTRVYMGLRAFRCTRARCYGDAGWKRVWVGANETRRRVSARARNTR